MLKELDNNDLIYFHDLEKKFPDVFNDGSIVNEYKNNPYNRIIVYLIDDKVVGFINYYDIIDRLEIANFNVLDYFQNKGIGSKLIDYVIKKYQNKYQNITLEVRSDNEKAIHLYKKKGFIEKAIRKNYYNGIDGILMEKKNQ